MRTPTTFLLLLLPFLLLLLTPTLSSKSTYIVHVSNSHKPPHFPSHADWYAASLASISSPSAPLYTYTTAAHGFSALLSASEAASLSSLPGVLSVEKDSLYHLHTTRTPQFLGLSDPAAFSPASGTAGDVVVGVLDTGAWPGSKSYDDAGLGPVGPGWKGECEVGPGFEAKDCNRKLVGARFFSKGYEAVMGRVGKGESRSPRDDDGHGTHTSSTAAGAVVDGANLFGFAEGTARGMAPKARIAVYKVCWTGGCFSSDILAALDKAVDDGVNVLSLSLGGSQSDYFRDTVAIGAFAAMQKGIFVSCSAGNAGPATSTLSNVAPWIATIGAGTLDRDFPAYVVLGNGKNYTGVSLYNGKPLSESTQLPLIYAGNATNATNGNLCMPGTLVPSLVAGKVVLCDRGNNARVQKGYVVKQAGGAGMVLANTAANGEELVGDAHLLPAATVGEKNGNLIKSYLFSDPHPTATIVPGGTKLNVKPSPVLAAFSSRGPNSITPNILKPDMIAPGVNILAGWSGAVGPTGLSVDDRRTGFNVVSGTSMSCPHVSGLAALLKSVHPEWSPAAIRSALMTTAYNTYPGSTGILDVATGEATTPFDIGAGHVDPIKARDPGLVYDITPDDYVDFLCALNYTALQLNAMTRRNAACDASKTYSIGDLNYPSFAVAFETASGGEKNPTSMAKYTRTLTNVGEAGTYKVTVSSTLKDAKITVEPMVLKFEKEGEKQSFTVSFAAASQPSGTEEFGRLEWSDGKHVVGSPIALTWT